MPSHGLLLCVHSIPDFSVCVKASSCKNTSRMGFEPTQDWPHLNSISSVKVLSSNTVSFWRMGRDRVARILLWEKVRASCWCIKGLQISKSIGMQESLLVMALMEENRPSGGAGKRHRLGWQKARATRTRATRASGPLSWTYIGGKKGGRCMLIGGQLPPGRMWLPKLRYMWRIVSPNSYLAPNRIWSSCCKQICDRRQLIKVELVTRSYLWALSVSTRYPLIK